MTTPRTHPYVWASWLPKLLAGESSCEWAVWFKAHYKGYAQQPKDLSDWTTKHTTLLGITREKLEAQGNAVTVEDENKFRLRGKSGALVQGKPDLISFGLGAVITDIKTGKRRDSHRQQVLLYMHGLPRAEDSPYPDVEFDGRIVYPDGAVEIPAAELTEDFRISLRELTRRIISPNPPGKVASPGECRFCDLTSGDCPDRVEWVDEDEEFREGTEDF
jgi:hypothetical protein